MKIWTTKGLVKSQKCLNSLHWFRFLIIWPRASQSMNKNYSLGTLLTSKHFRLSSMRFQILQYVEVPKVKCGKYCWRKSSNSTGNVYNPGTSFPAILCHSYLKAVLFTPNKPVLRSRYVYLGSQFFPISDTRSATPTSYAIL